MPIRCEIVSQDKTVFQGDVDIVVLPGTDGEMGILPHHAPLLTTLKYGYIKVRTKSEEQIFTVAGGVAEIQPTIVTVLADASENVEEIDVERAETAKKRAQEQLEKVSTSDVDSFLALEAALRRSNLRLEAARKYHTHKRPSYNKED